MRTWGIEYAGLTDGNRWELYRVFKPGKLEERRVLEVALVDTPAVKTALKLLVLWRSNLALDEQPVEVGVPVLVEKTQASQTPPDEAELASEPLAPEWVALSEYHPAPKPPCPRTIKFWDGEKKDLSRWHEVLTLVAEKLHATGHLTVDRVPVKSSPASATCFVNATAAHPNGRPFGRYEVVSGSLYVNTDLNAGQIRSNTRKLLEQSGLDPADVYLHVEQ